MGTPRPADSSEHVLVPAFQDTPALSEISLGIKEELVELLGEPAFHNLFRWLRHHRCLFSLADSDFLLREERAPWITMMTEMAQPLAGFGVVPDVGDFDFDLGALDNFTDMDIDMESFNLTDEAGTAGDPFGNLSFEQSLNLVDFTSVATKEDLSILDDFDVKEPIKQDCMWSSFQDASSPIRRSPLHINKHRRRRDSSGVGAAGLTPPSSYINDHLSTFDAPLPSDEESSEELDVVSPPAICSRVLATDSMSEDHCYSSSGAQLAPWSENTSASAPLTPPESSEDEDSSAHIPKPPPGATRKKAGLSEIENDRFNKVVKNTLLKNSLSLSKKSARSITMSEAKAGKTKFRFLLTTPRNKNSLLIKKSSEQRPNTTAYRLKRSLTTVSPTSSPNTLASSRRKSRFEEVSSRRVDQREARDVHNQMERQRRNDLKNAFASLKDFVPTIANSDRASKQMVLDKAIDYCKNLKSKEWTTRKARET